MLAQTCLALAASSLAAVSAIVLPFKAIHHDVEARAGTSSSSSSNLAVGRLSDEAGRRQGCAMLTYDASLRPAPLYPLPSLPARSPPRSRLPRTPGAPITAQKLEVSNLTTCGVANVSWTGPGVVRPIPRRCLPRRLSGLGPTQTLIPVRRR